MNYEDLNLNVSVPVFSIHGNHDDIAGTGRLSSMDILSSTGLLNYFGKWRDLSAVEIDPIILKKNNTSIALYGLSHIHDSRLARLFRDKKVKVRKPEIADSGIFNLMVLHQNRADRGRFNYLPESELPSFLDLIVWGHEHDCRINPEPIPKIQSYVTQPGSSVATSLSEGESIEKCVGILEVLGKDFKLAPVKLKTVRPFIFRSIDIDEFDDELKLNEGNTRVKLEKFFSQNVDEMIIESKARISGHPKQPTLPLIRLRVMFTKESHVINTTRFGQLYDQKIANPESMLAFKKIVKRNPKDIKLNPDEAALKSAFDKKEQQDRVEDVVENYFKELEDEKDKLKLFSLKSLSEVCRLLVDKEDEQAAVNILEKHYEKAIAFLDEKMCHEDMILDAIGEFQATKSKKALEEAVVDNSRNRPKPAARQQTKVASDDDDSDDGNDSRSSSASSFKAPAAKRGKAAAATTRGAAASTSTRGRGKKAADANVSVTPTAKKTTKAATKQTSIVDAIQKKRAAANTTKSPSIFVVSSDSD